MKTEGSGEITIIDFRAQPQHLEDPRVMKLDVSFTTPDLVHSILTSKLFMSVVCANCLVSSCTRFGDSVLPLSNEAGINKRSTAFKAIAYADNDADLTKALCRRDGSKYTISSDQS